MTTILIAASAAAAVVILGAWLRWAVKPVLVSYQAGVSVRGIAAARIREQQGEIDLLIRTLAYAVTGGAEPMERERPTRSAWYDGPLPIAVLASVLRPARGVRKLRSSDDAIAYMIDAMLAQERKHHETGELATSSN